VSTLNDANGWSASTTSNDRSDPLDLERGLPITERDVEALRDFRNPSTTDAEHARFSATLEEIERDHILSVLERVGWRVSGERGAASILGLKRTTLEARMGKLGIARPS